MNRASIKVYENRSVYCNSYATNMAGVYDVVRNNEVYDFHSNKMSEAQVLLSSLLTQEETQSNTALLNRILRGGGLCEYINKLEVNL